MTAIRIDTSSLSADECVAPMPAEACTDIGYDDAAPEGFAIAALFALCCLLAVGALSVVAYIAA